MASQAGQLAGEIVKAALKRPVHERAAYLAASCAGNDTLRQEVETLLRYYQNPEMHSGSLLNSPSKIQAKASPQPPHPLTQVPSVLKPVAESTPPVGSANSAAPTLKIEAADLPPALRQTAPVAAPQEPAVTETLDWLARLTAEDAPSTSPVASSGTEAEREAAPVETPPASSAAASKPDERRAESFKSPTVKKADQPKAFDHGSPFEQLFKRVTLPPQTPSPLPSPAAAPAPPPVERSVEPPQTAITPPSKPPEAPPARPPAAAASGTPVEGFNTGAKALDGRMLGAYQLLYEIGRGGMGRVYLAEDTRLGRRVALKLLLRSSTRSPERVRHFEQEARAASSLNHPNILTIHEIGEIKGVHYLATEFVEGFTLRQVIEHRRLTLTKIIDVGIQVANALSAAHGANIVHRDIKPENLMVRLDGYVKVLDFGIAKLLEKTTGLSPDAPTTQPFDTQPGAIVGTADYMSPEQARGVRVDNRTDIFSFGVVLYEMVTGVRPFVGATSTDVVAALLTREPIPITQRLAGAPDALHRIIKRALSKERDLRYGSAREMANDLKLLRQDLEIAARATQRTTQRPVPRATQPPAQPAAPRQTQRPAPATSPPIAVVQPAPATHHPTEYSGFLRVPQRTGDLLQRKANWWPWLLLLCGVVGLGAGIWVNYYRTPETEALALMPFTATHLSGGNAPLAREDEEVLRLALAEGLHESLWQRFAPLPKLRVAARNSVRNFRKGADARDIGNYLNARHVLTGRLVTRGNSVTVSLELFDGATGESRWSQRYERTLNDLHTLPEALSAGVAEQLPLGLNAVQTARLARRETAHAEAFLHCLKGRYLWQQRQPETLKSSLNYLRRATELDPNYARAHAALAESYALAPLYGVLPVAEAAALGRAAAARALQLDAQLAEAYRAQGFIAHQFEWNFAAAEKAFQRALELNPNYAAAWQEYGSLLTSLGRAEEGLRAAQSARALDPLSSASQTNVGAAYYYAGRYQQAVDECLGAREFNPKAAGAYKYLGLAYRQMSRLPDALEALQKAASLAPQDNELKAQLACVEADAGKPADAQKRLIELRASRLPSYRLATIYAALGEKEQALVALTQAVAAREPGVVWLKVDPQLNPLRQDQRFKELLKQVGLP